MPSNRCEIDSEGRVRGPVSISWNEPWPCRNGDSGGMAVPSGVTGMLVHTQVGNNPGSVAWFNDSASQASAHFCVAQDGAIVQMGPVTGWMAWHCAVGNPHWFGCEFADDGQPSNPLTLEQITAGAQLLELLSRDDVGRFPMQISNSPGTEGLGWHGMGGLAFGGHFDCPGDVRKAQRPEIIKVAKDIRAGSAPVTAIQHVTVGDLSLAALATQHHCEASAILRETAEHSPGAIFPANVASFINDVFAGTLDPRADIPAGLHLFLPG